jgi:hypothetical protein
LSLYASTGLVLDDDLTDVGGSQDLIRDSAGIAFANGQIAVFAQGTLTAPSTDGVYAVHVEPQKVSVLAADLTQGPTGGEPDDVIAGNGFIVVVGNPEVYTLAVTVNDSSRGKVKVVPDYPVYPAGMTVELTGIPIGNNHLEHWLVDNPDDPDPPVEDHHNPLYLVMDHNYEVQAVFECGSGVELLLPLPTIVMGVCGFVSRRWRGHMLGGQSREEDTHG